ncbi:MAG: hypothetical protein OXI20_23340 [Rhodospirillales bacterium]|nr:hypothetical protein [Rhodospirillales bacterium]
MSHPTEFASRTIRARIHESAVKRVTRTYAATLAEIFTELLQNARRAAATRIRIAVERAADDRTRTGESQFTVTVADDGTGIADPAVLLSFGENGWSDELVRREDAAGFGFASLARRGCAVSSRPRAPDGAISAGWKVELESAHFLGEAEAGVQTHDEAPYPYGTSISFVATEALTAVRNAAENAARHYPLPVIFEDRTEDRSGAGEELPRRAFLDGAVHAEPWRGLAFGVFRDRRHGYNDPDLNFHGLTLPVRLPAVETVNGPAWTVRADIDDCPDLELVLPARKEAVENGFLADMREAARLAVYRAMAADPDPRPAYQDWTRAREAGIDIAPPPAMLRPWRPCVADSEYWRDPPRPVPAGADAMVMNCDPEPPEAQALWRAAERAGIETRLFEADRRLDGYPWYDAIERIVRIRTEATVERRPYALDTYPVPERTGAPKAPLPRRPDAIRMSLTVRAGKGVGRMIDLDADLAFAGEAWAWVGDALPLVAAGSAIRPFELAGLMRAGFFSFSDDADADSWETQRNRFDEEALHIATRLLLSDDEACRSSIAEAVRRELMWLVPRGRAIDIRIRRPDVTVTLAAAEPS